MPSILLEIGYSTRNYNKPIHNFSVLSSVSNPNYEKTTSGVASRHPKDSVNDPDWSFDNNYGMRGYFKKHNSFRDQELYNRISRGFVIRQGTDVKYYTTTYNPENDPLYHEDNNRTIDRVFDVPVIMSFQPEIELYNKLGIQQLDETEIYIHMGLFLEMNYQSLRRACIEPKCPINEHNPDLPNHNPIWSQRGYEAFRYYGYTFDQIAPKAGDKIKIEAFNTLYEIESVKDASPQYQHRWRKYWWRAFIKPAHDMGQTISQDVLEDPEQQKFINTLIGLQGGGVTVDANGNLVDENGNIIKNPLDATDAINELKKDILFRPPEVAPDVDNISEDPNFTPGNDDFGGW